MKLKYIVIFQIVLLLSAVTAGNFLNGDLADGPRNIHRLAGVLSGLAAAVLVFKSFMGGANVKVKFLSVLALLSIGVAAIAGNGLKGSTNYNQMFNTMRAGGVFAIVVSIVILMQLRTKRIATKEDTPELPETDK